MSARRQVLPLGVVPRALCREEAARWVCVSPTKFDQMVRDGRMPRPKMIDRLRVWDVRALDRAFDGLPELPDADTANPWLVP